MKKRTLGLIIAGVAAASMIGTGFAAWVITGNASAEANGNIQVDTVTDNSITLTAAWKENEDGKINFIGPATQNAANEWLSFNDENSYGFVDLSETLVLTFGLGNDVNPADFNITFTFAATDTAPSNYESAISSKYINAPTINGSAFTSGSYTCTLANLGVSSSALTKEVDLAFTWGKAFNDTNPYDFYNGFAYGTKVAKNDAGTPVENESGSPVQTLAKEELTALNTALSGVSFKLTITVGKAA